MIMAGEKQMAHHILIPSHLINTQKFNQSQVRNILDSLIKKDCISINTMILLPKDVKSWLHYLIKIKKILKIRVRR